tara:strand:+ start:346 stop:2790 length:2445 start_codon:yes stop_codon:yes gene_type:complete
MAEIPLGAGGPQEEILENTEQLDIVEVPEQPNVTELEDGSAIIGELPEEEGMPSEEIPFDANLADFIDDTELGKVSDDLSSSIKDDISSRDEWEQIYKSGLELLGIKYEDRTEPFEGATGVIHPLLSESVTQFQAQAYRELLPAGGPVRVHVMGQETPEVVAQAERVKNYMNYEITCTMEEFDPELDQMLFYLPIVGSTFKKIYFDPLLQRAVSRFVHAEDIIVPYSATDLLTATRVTHVVTMSKNDIRKLQLTGFYKDVDLPDSDQSATNYTDIKEQLDKADGTAPSSYDEDLVVHEIHTNLDLAGFEDKNDQGEETGLQYPYIVSILEKTGDILSIRRNYDPNDPLMRKKQYFVHYKFLPGLGFYGFGLTHMMGGLSKASTSLLRQLIDAGTLSNLPAGFKARGARIRDEDSPLSPGEFRDIDVAGMDIRQSLMALPFKEPSGTLYNLLGTLVDSGRRFASMADMKISEMGGETPVGTTMAIMERGTKVMSAIHKRLHYSQKHEFKLLAQVFAQNPKPYPYQVPGAPPMIMQTDFDDRIDVIPVSDPNIFSMSQRIALSQTQLQLVQSNPEMHGGQQGLYQAYRKMYEALGVSNIDQILPLPQQPQPANPAKENQEAMRGARLQAFPQQNHEAHIEAHLAILSTPVAQVNATIVMTLQGHIQEHIGMMAEAMAQAEITATIPPEQQMMMQQNPQMMESMQMQIQNRAAEIIGDLTEKYAQTLAPEGDSDPLVEIRKQELAIKGADVQRRAQEFEQKQKLEEEKERNQRLVDQQRIDIQEESLDDKTRIAEERIQAQKDIAVFNANNRRNQGG